MRITKKASKSLSTFIEITFLVLTLCSKAYCQQLIVDGTTQTTLENCNGSCIVGGGLRQGINLFHSFREFNVNSGAVVTFIDPGVKNIINRITGNKQSRIFGEIGVNKVNSSLSGDSNLFLINPNGFIFGPNSSLDIGGSLVVTTADLVEFKNGENLKTTPTEIPILTVDPTALAFESPTGRITNLSQTTVNKSSNIASSGLQVPTGKNILLVGGDIKLDKSGLNAFGGRIELGGLSEKGVVSLDFSKGNPSLIFPEQTKRSNIYINNSVIDVSLDKNGDISLHGNNINIFNNSVLRAGIESGLGMPGNQAGDIQLSALEGIDVRESEIFNRIWEKGIGNSGNIIINTKSLSLLGSKSKRTRIDSSNLFGNGQTGNISIFASDKILLNQNSFIFNNLVFANGKSGLIDIQTGELYLNNFDGIEETSGIETNNIGSTGITGGIRINAIKKIDLQSNSLVGSQIAAGGSGELGNIEIVSPYIFLSEGAQINTQLFEGTGIGGDIKLVAPSAVFISGFGTDGFSSGLVSSTQENTKGSAGNITVNTGIFQVGDGGLVSARSFSAASAGEININTLSFRALNGGQILNNAFSEGDAGNIKIFSRDSIVLMGSDPNFSKRLRLRAKNNPNDIPFLNLIGANSGLFAGSSGSGKGGSINLKAKNIELSNGAVIDVRTTSNGVGGVILIKSNTLSARNGGKILSTTGGSKASGDITIEVVDSIELDGRNTGIFANTLSTSTGSGGSVSIDPRIVSVLNGAEISVSSEGSGSAGNIFLQSGNLTLDQGNISATSTSDKGGNIVLDIDNLLLLKNNSSISASAGKLKAGGNGGNITIDTDLLVARQNSDITATAFTGDGGNISIRTLGEYRSLDSDITASSEFGIDGEVEISNPEVDPSENLSEQPETVESPQEIVKGCRAGQSLGSSTFTHVGRGGLPLSPHQTQTPTTVWQDLRSHNLQPTSISTTDPSPRSLIPTPPPSITEAQGWTKDSQGRIYLTANVPQPTQSPQPIATC